MRENNGGLCEILELLVIVTLLNKNIKEHRTHVYII